MLDCGAGGRNVREKIGEKLLAAENLYSSPKVPGLTSINFSDLHRILGDS